MAEARLNSLLSNAKEVLITNRTEMKKEEMQQKASEARKAAKELQRKLLEVTDPDERKQMARRMNELFAEASSMKDEAKHCHYMEESIERDFRCIETDLVD